MENIKVVVIGENCTDKFVYGDVNRLCPEAPVPVLNPRKVKKNPGMAGNVVQNLNALNSSLDITFLHQPEKIVKTRYVDEKSNQMILRMDEGEDLIEKFTITPEIVKVISEADIVIISDYNKGFLTTETITLIGHHAKLSILDSKRILVPAFSTISFIKLNKVEREQQDEVLIKKLNIITTLGKKGAEYMGKIYPTKKPKDTIDVSGAGDTFTSAFILKYYETRNISESIYYANVKASDVVSRRGVVVPK